MRGLKDKVVIVTGAASGIGRAIALRFGAEGAFVAVFDINDAGAAETAAAIAAAGGKARATHVDITDHASIEAGVDALEKAEGRIDVLVNNAGWDIPIAFVETDRPFWDKVIAINLYGPLNMHHVVLPRMMARRAGRIVNIASDAGRVGSSGEAVYSACKGGIIAFTKTIAREAARAGHRRQLRVPGPDRHAAVRRVQGAFGRWREDRRGARPRDPVPASRTARRLSGHRGFPCVRRRGLHHRPGDLRLRRADDEWLIHEVRIQ